VPAFDPCIFIIVVYNRLELRGDSISRFMALYRPSYTFCRRNNREKMLLYINDKFKEFKKPSSAHKQRYA